MELSIIGLLAVAYAADLVTATVPMLVLVQNGVSSGLLTPIISFESPGSISTAVNMISGIVTRCVNAVERRMRSEQERQNGHLVRNAIATLIFTFLAFAIAQFGLLAVVKQEICVPWICSIYHIVYSIYHSCDRDKRKRDLKFTEKVRVNDISKKGKKNKLKIKKQ